MHYVFLPTSTLACLAFLGLTPMLYQQQLLLLMIMVATLGLPHGALDAFIAKQAGHWRTRLEFSTFVLIYLAIAIGIFGLWLLVPVLALPAFLLMSAWHFGEDWHGNSGANNALQRWFFGGAVVSLPSLFHGQEVAAIYAILAHTNVPWLAQIQGWLAPLLALSLLVMTHDSLGNTPGLGWRWTELLALCASAAVLPPLLYFALYFCCLHSPSHFFSVLSAARKHQRLEAGIHGLVFTIGALVLLGMLYHWALPGLSFNSASLHLVFVGLAALTVPHILLLDLMPVRGFRLFSPRAAGFSQANI